MSRSASTELEQDAASAAVDLARRGRLYPAVILHGGAEDQRRKLALDLAHTLLCEALPPARPCGVCRHCRRMVWPGEKSEAFHPDFFVLERDLRTSTSVDATRTVLQAAQVSPFEARGQVFVIANAETLSNEAANSLLKVLEEPPVRAPRNFLLLVPSRLDLLPTLRSRSLSVYLGSAEPIDRGRAAEVSRAFAECVTAFSANGAPLHLLTAAGALASVGGFEDPRASRPWAVAAQAVRLALDASNLASPWRRRLLALAEALLAAPDLRLRGIPADRILEGLVAQHLNGL